MEDHSKRYCVDVSKMPLEGRAAGSQLASFLFGLWAMVFIIPVLALGSVEPRLTYFLFFFSFSFCMPCPSLYILLLEKHHQYLMLYNNMSGAGDMTQLVRYLPCEQEDLSLGSQYTYNKSDIGAHAIPELGIPVSLAELVSSRFRERPCLRK